MVAEASRAGRSFLTGLEMAVLGCTTRDGGFTARLYPGLTLRNEANPSSDATEMDHQQAPNQSLPDGSVWHGGHDGSEDKEPLPYEIQFSDRSHCAPSPPPVPDDDKPEPRDASVTTTSLIAPVEPGPAELEVAPQVDPVSDATIAQQVDVLEGGSHGESEEERVVIVSKRRPPPSTASATTSAAPSPGSNAASRGRSQLRKPRPPQIGPMLDDTMDGSIGDRVAALKRKRSQPDWYWNERAKRAREGLGWDRTGQSREASVAPPKPSSRVRDDYAPGTLLNVNCEGGWWPCIGERERALLRSAAARG